MEWLTRRFELSRGGEKHNVRPMEGIRGFAVFLVFLVHYVTLVKPWFAGSSIVLLLGSALHSIGNTGVDLFFVLSGYLIYGSLISRPQRFAQYMSRRIKRIYPAFTAVFIAYVLLSFVFPSESKIPPSAYAGIIYPAQNFFLLPGLFPISPMNTVAWSLSYEMFYYLIIPIVIAALRLRQRSATWRVCFFSIVTVATIIFCAAYGGHVRLVMFIAGILLYEAIGSDRVAVPGNAFALLFLGTSFLITLLPLSSPYGYALKIAILFAAFFFLCFSCLKKQNGWLPRAFSWTPLRWLGNMSYSYYLLHGLALKAGFLVLARILPIASYDSLLSLVLMIGMFAFTLIPTAILFLTIERPFSLSPYAKSSNELATKAAY